MNDETYAYFFIEGFDCDPSEISRHLGLKPTESFGQSDKSVSSWLLYSPLDKDTVFLDKHLDALLKILDSKSREVVELVENYDCGINCIGKHFTPNPGFNLSKEILRRLAFYGIAVDFDIYCNCEKCANGE